ncbi:hypothetical protein KL905_002167 [Ogataea polymorpha]|uniref:Zn(2)-C6 fungal-type domain-containing protein n=2 Tax=Ogataea polymorpha TaxID=460523 RepID=A0A9P8PR15_9ASCO|nr:hypothetical protein KL937_001814 [Ogataea polymorpha]KAG7889889.1 hypothetical protein KL936_002563 [Ogataea polymorpha]KAG7901328.1 hypothetical protein KL935_002394 [Ogataea polymorpha]KAG7909582.1 hypothetical protein KL906_002338 [Ogataea polymorpha]KAG7917104.1 hypothetical protein KL927_002878 [Ogataea polymorpha]
MIPPKRTKERYTRTSKACDLCHRKKTRCLKSGSSVSCLRCLALNEPCSLAPNASETPPSTLSQPQTQDFAEMSLRTSLASISSDVKEVLRVLRESTLPEPSSAILDSYELNMSSRPITTIKTSPLAFVAHVQPETSLFPPAVLNQLNLLPSLENMQTDIVSVRLLSYDQAAKLLDIFRDRYGRWISFPDTFSTPQLLTHIRKTCPLLLTVACALSLKYGDPNLKELVYHEMLLIIKRDLERSLVNMPKRLEFLQCLIILSIYSVSLSDESAELRLDGWYLSHIGIHLFLRLNSYGLFEYLYDPALVQFEFNELTSYRIINTLVLIHLAYSLLSGKQSSYSLGTLTPKKFYDHSLSTNFDYRIIAEVEVYLFAYRYLHLGESLEIVRSQMKGWLSEWEELFTSSANEFVEIDYHLAELLLIFGENDADLQKVRENAEAYDAAYFHSAEILKLAVSITDDSYFAFLSDQMHMIIVYNAMVVGTLQQPSDPAVDGLLQHLKNRYTRIATSENDMASKYSMMLQSGSR